MMNKKQVKYMNESACETFERLEKRIEKLEHIVCVLADKTNYHTPDSVEYFLKKETK